ncbi:MAG TPA: hypothetical protein VGB77_14230 [Abditibacteriaceae bacterium]
MQRLHGATPDLPLGPAAPELCASGHDLTAISAVTARVLHCDTRAFLFFVLFC